MTDDVIFQDGMRTKLLVEQHFHGCFGVNFSTATEDEVLLVARELIKCGIGGFFPTLVTDSLENIKHQVEIIKSAAQKQTPEMAKIFGVHLEGIFINSEKAGIHDPNYFMAPTVENYKKIEDDFIKIVTLAPELDKDGALRKYLRLKGVRVQAGHCVGDDLTDCTGATHLYNAMGAISHRSTKTALSALLDDKIYTEVIADGVHLSDDILNLTFRTKPLDKVILVSDSLPLAHSDLEKCEFAGSMIYNSDGKATSKEGTIAGSTSLLNDIVKTLCQKEMFKKEYVENVYKYHKIELDGCIYWDDEFNVMAVEKDGVVLYRE